MASSCPSSRLKEGNLSPLPTDTIRCFPSEAGGGGRILRVFLAFNGILAARVEGVPFGPGGTRADSVQTPGQLRMRQRPLQLGKLLPWLETLPRQQVFDGEEGEQLLMLGIHVEEGELWQFAGEGEMLLNRHQ